ncbi:box C/D snoRNA protein 1 [Anoplophora glabripennis]|uniref:box C/D snoRNA protein 1 n=1 Tax=Anoplophora glabripennis TaxID=217634 RepID=UPI0008739620|nr:box C/D snoRNA protein 1 [Anoplophora glabripennis]
MEVDTKPMDIKVEPSTSSAGTSSKLGVCEVCAFHDAKYTCPRCEVKTCSLKCNKIHKLEIECDGQRDRTKFIPLNKFTNLDLSSDYRLLEEITRSVEASRKKFGKRWTHISGPLMKLRNAAKSKRITLKYLPYKFARRRANSTYLNYKTNIIHWQIDWVFVSADNLKLTDKNVPEIAPVSSVLSKHLSKQSDNCLQEKLQYYQAADIPGIRVLMKAEQTKGKKFYELDPTLTLRECLEKKLIIEYPTIYVVLKDHLCGYNVIDSDDEDDSLDGRIKSGNEVVTSIVNNAENDESLYRSLKNLLFVSEYSDEELSLN